MAQNQGLTWWNVAKIIPRMSPDHGLTAACGHRRLPRKVLQAKDLRLRNRRSGAEMPVQVSAPGRIRTCGTRFRRAVLYPLSYGGGLS